MLHSWSKTALRVQYELHNSSQKYKNQKEDQNSQIFVIFWSSFLVKEVKVHAWDFEIIEQPSHIVCEGS